MKNVLIQEGQRVQEEDLLVELHQIRELLQFMQAEKSYSTALVQGSQSHIKEQELNLTLAEKDLEATTLKAPFSGLITDLDIREGMRVSQGQVLGRIINEDSFKVKNQC